ncbi:MAG: hypothetical protein GY854_10930 [Deltaproteobacteria bacterium]|nr:hypothetical protein [Deltaproteobacteria bacterium]
MITIRNTHSLTQWGLAQVLAICFVFLTGCFDSQDLDQADHPCAACLPCERCVEVENGQGVCEAIPRQYKQCGADGDVHWFNSCDEERDLAKQCPRPHTMCANNSATDAICECTQRESDGECICPPHWDSEQNCSACLGNWDISNDCEECAGNWDEQTDCSECKNRWIDENNDCTTCPEYWDPEVDCNDCAGHALSIENDCDTCPPGWEGERCDAPASDVDCPLGSGWPCICYEQCDDGTECVHLPVLPESTYGICARSCLPTRFGDCSSNRFSAMGLCVEFAGHNLCVLSYCFTEADCPSYQECQSYTDFDQLIVNICYPMY